MTIRRSFAVLARNISLLALLGCLAACQMPFGMGQRTPEPKPQPVAPAPAAGPCVVLALPSSGPYAAIAGKVRHGAQMAQNELSTHGIKLRVETINTEAPDWLQRLDALPPACTVVGGPLQARNYAQAREHGSLEKRAFFTFVPSLEQGDEGARAWRFFPSPQDQIDTLIGFATTGLNIRTYGAFYPTDAYGPRMTGLMEQSLASQNMLLQKASYNPAEPASWSDAVAPLIRAQTPQGSKTPVPQTSFEALFLPDSWKSMEMLTTSLLYNGEDRLVLLGTTLWEQSLSGKTVANADKYTLAVFPAAWNQPQAPRTLQAPGTDFWNALGYDFVRFAATMGLDSRLTTPQITARAQRASKMIWGMAPISWDNAGVAHQKLFLFGVTANGMTPVDAEAFQQARARVLQQAALRMQGLPPVDATGAPIAAPAAGAEATPAVQTGQPQPSTPIMSNTPRPSYKLSLPAAR